MDNEDKKTLEDIKKIDDTLKSSFRRFHSTIREYGKVGIENYFKNLSQQEYEKKAAETLEYIYKQRITINIFSDNVIIGLFLGISFMLFNILKSINLIRYVNMAKSHIYLTIRTILYIGLFTICIYYLLPYINYELLAALVLGLILTTAFGSILLINSIDVFEKQTSKSLQITPIIRSTVLPLTNQITTILIIITVLLLPIIK